MLTFTSEFELKFIQDVPWFHVRLGSTCNHVAAILFKLKKIWREGTTNKSCTDRPCIWNKYGAEKNNTKSIMVKDLLFRKPVVRKIKKSSSKGVSKEAGFAESNPQLSPFSLDTLANALRECCPNAAVFKSLGPMSPHDIAQEVSVTTSARPSLQELYVNCKTSDDILNILKSFTKDDVDIIEVATRGQSNNNIWHNQRIYIITASIAYEVHTKVLSIKAKKPSHDPTPLLKRISGSTPNYSKSIPALKYGNEMESEARECYKDLIAITHKDVSVKATGIIISHENPEFGASPDASVTCSCCEPGLLEIKCPISIAHTSPNENNQDCLLKTDKSFQLKRRGKYFAQVQWQMGICDKSWCDFFIYSRHGHFLERVLFDKSYYIELKSNARYFYMNCVIPFVLQSSHSSIVSQTDAIVDLTTDSFADENVCTSAEHMPFINVLTPSCSKRRLPLKSLSQNKKQKLSLPTYICGACSKVCLEPHQIASQGDNSVQCDSCGTWFHFVCVKYTDYSSDNWVCQDCLLAMNHLAK